jgi:solute carrier family 25 phosphate transporter 3
MQVNPQKYPQLIFGIRTVLAEEGAVGLLKGWAPTAIGYSLQGAGTWSSSKLLSADIFYSRLMPMVCFLR